MKLVSLALYSSVKAFNTMKLPYYSPYLVVLVRIHLVYLTSNYINFKFMPAAPNIWTSFFSDGPFTFCNTMQTGHCTKHTSSVRQHSSHGKRIVSWMYQASFSIVKTSLLLFILHKSYSFFCFLLTNQWIMVCNDVCKIIV